MIHLNYITPQHQDELLALITTYPHNKQQKEANSIRRYGDTKSYHGGEYIGDLPEWSAFLQQDFTFTSLTIREYHIGQAVGWHIDNARAGEKIGILSLLSDSTMQFRKDGKVIDCELPAMSFYVLQDELRWEFQHRILPVKSLRYSIVLRNS